MSLYVCDYLNFKYTITHYKNKHPNYSFKTFIGFRQDDLTYNMPHDFRGMTHWEARSRLNQRKLAETGEHYVDMYVEHFADYIMALYGFKQVTTEIHEYANMLIEQWISE